MNKSQRRINIVLLTDCLGDITGGAEKQIFELAKRLPKDRYNVTIASMETNGNTSESLIRSVNCQLQIFPVVRIYGLSGLIQGVKFVSFLQRHSIDVLMTYHFGSDIWGAFWGHLAGVRSIISNRRDMGFWRHQSHVIAYRLINPWVNKIVTVTGSIKQMVIKTEHVPADKLEVIFNGVDLPPGSVDILQKKAELGLNPLNTVVMHVANIRAVKGHQYLIKAFAQAARIFENIELVLIGKDELNGQLDKLAQKLGIQDKILFLGQRSDVTELLSVSDICVLPSLSEGMSNAILEYMAAAKPVIATNIGGNPELVRNGFNGLLVEKENVEQLQDALLKLLGDKEKRQIMGQNGFLSVKTEFSMETMLQKYEKLFQIKVLHLVSSAGMYGAEQMMLTLAGRTDGVVHTVGAFHNQHNPHLEIIEEAKKRRFNTVIFGSKGRIDLNTVKAVKDFVLHNNIDIIHTHNYKANFIGALAARWSRKRWVVTIHGWTGGDVKLRWYEAFDAFILKFADKINCVSQANYRKLLRRGFSPDRLSHILNGVDLDRFSRSFNDPQLKAEFDISDNDTVLAIVGRLSFEKGHEVLFKAMAQIIKQNSFVKLLVIGDGPLRNKLEEQMKSLKLSEYIVFTGVREDMPDIYGICDILVNSSYTEGLPMTILEAMASKVAVVATSVGALPQVIQDQKNGLLVRPKDPDALVDALTQLINDHQKRRQLAQEAYSNIRVSLSDQTMFSQYKQVYEAVLK